MFELLNRWFARRPETVVLDERGVTRTLGNGKAESVRWATLREVFIVTTDEGPWVNDVFWVLLDDDGGCAVPWEAECAQSLLARLQQLNGFDNQRVIEAMGCTDNARFDVWRREPAKVAKR